MILINSTCITLYRCFGTSKEVANHDAITH